MLKYSLFNRSLKSLGKAIGREDDVNQIKFTKDLIPIPKAANTKKQAKSKKTTKRWNILKQYLFLTLAAIRVLSIDSIT